MILDQVMLRGRLDVCLPLADAGLIVDYKTDDVEASQVDSRAQEHHGQMEQYRLAMRRITGNAAQRVCLVFLKPRVVWEMPLD